MIHRIIQFFKDKWRGNLLGGISRSSKWTTIRKMYLKQFPTCAVCGGKGKLLRQNEVHHCIPFSVDKSKELDTMNMIVLCRDHHFFVGHLMDWKSFNENIRMDSEQFLDKIKNRPKVG